MAGRILDMGDVRASSSRPRRRSDADQAQRMASKVEQGGLHPSTTSWNRCRPSKKMGSLSKLLGMLPGMGHEAAVGVAGRPRDRPVSSHHPVDDPGEREDPKVLNASRRQRIIRRRVSGQNINNLVDRFADAEDDKPDAGGAPVCRIPPMPGGGKKAKGRTGGKTESQKAGPQPGQAGAASSGVGPLVDPTSIRTASQFKGPCSANARAEAARLPQRSTSAMYCSWRRRWTPRHPSHGVGMARPARVW